MKSDRTVSGIVPRWMRIVLLSAALYSVVWGIWTVLWPSSLFVLVGMEPPGFLYLWQSIGLWIGVFGVGYAIAATNPFRHWPIILIGLLGKILGPVGFIWVWWQGQVPLSFGAVLITNDIIWWVPFVIILARTARSAGMGPDEIVGDYESIETALAQARTTCCLSLRELSLRSPILLVFLRHFGCTFCMEALSDLGRLRERIQSTGVRIVLVHMSSDERAQDIIRSYGLYGIDHVSDRSRRLYRAFGFSRARLSQLFGPVVWWRGLQAMVEGGHSIGELEGDGYQMPGLALVSEGRVLRLHAHKTAAERPNYVAFAAVETPHAATT